MRTDGLIERVTAKNYTRLVSEDLSMTQGRRQGYCDYFGLIRLLEEAYQAYQSTHVVDVDYPGITFFPYAWLLERGDKVYNYTRNEYYTIARVAQMYEEPSNQSGDYPDPRYWHNFRATNRGLPIASDYAQSHGICGYGVVLHNAEGEVVTPEHPDALFFESKRYMVLRPRNNSADEDEYLANPDGGHDALPSNMLPDVTYYKLREQPHSRGKFLGDDPSPKARNEKGALTLRADTLIRFQCWTKTAYDLQRFVLYFRRFMDRYTHIFQFNGVQNVIWWQNTVSDRRVNLANNNTPHGENVEYGFTTMYQSDRVDERRKGVDLYGPFVKTRLDNDGASPI